MPSRVGTAVRTRCTPEHRRVVRPARGGLPDKQGFQLVSGQEKPWASPYASGMRNLTNCLNHGEHIVTNLFHLLRVGCLNIEAQQQFGVGRAKVEPPVLCFDCHSVKVSIVMPGFPSNSARTAAIDACASATVVFSSPLSV